MKSNRMMFPGAGIMALGALAFIEVAASPIDYGSKRASRRPDSVPVYPKTPLTAEDGERVRRAQERQARKAKAQSKGFIDKR